MTNRDKLSWFFLSALCGALAVIVGSTEYAHAHSGNPALPTFVAGTPLTAVDLNNAFAHTHNTFSGGIIDTHINTSAAIAHTKLATPALVPKAILSTTTACDGAQAAGTDCTTGVELSRFLSTSGGAGSGNSALEAGGGATAGIYQLTLAYTPTDANYWVLVTSGTAGVYCSATTRATTTTNGHFIITCRNDAGTATNANIMVSVFDTN